MYSELVTSILVLMAFSSSIIFLAPPFEKKSPHVGVLSSFMCGLSALATFDTHIFWLESGVVFSQKLEMLPLSFLLIILTVFNLVILSFTYVDGGNSLKEAR